MISLHRSFALGQKLLNCIGNRCIYIRRAISDNIAAACACFKVQMWSGAECRDEDEDHSNINT
jgi:hypothetical protein